jgi:hypothetical protein
LRRRSSSTDSLMDPSSFFQSMSRVTSASITCMDEEYGL